MTDFVNNGAYLADRVDLPRKKTNLVIFLFWNIVMVVPLLWGVSSLLRTGILVSLLTVAVLLLTGKFHEKVGFDGRGCGNDDCHRILWTGEIRGVTPKEKLQVSRQH